MSKVKHSEIVHSNVISWQYPPLGKGNEMSKRSTTSYDIAKEAGAILLCDIAHIAGLVVTGHHPDPIPYSDFVTTTNHKTLRGPRGGIILCKSKWAKKIDQAIFPGIQGGPMMHAIAAKAVCGLAWAL